MKEKPFNITIEGKKHKLTVENTGIALFWKERDCEYMDIHEPLEGKDEEQHIWVFNHKEFLIWMGGVALDRDDLKILNLSEKKNGSFDERYGWRPPVMVEWKPSPLEEEMWAHITADVDYHKDLNNALRSDFEA